MCILVFRIELSVIHHCKSTAHRVRWLEVWDCSRLMQYIQSDAECYVYSRGIVRDNSKARKWPIGWVARSTPLLLSLFLFLSWSFVSVDRLSRKWPDDVSFHDTRPFIPQHTDNSYGISCHASSSHFSHSISFFSFVINIPISVVIFASFVGRRHLTETEKNVKFKIIVLVMTLDKILFTNQRNLFV